MRILVGVDGATEDTMPARLLKRLQFPSPHVALVHSIIPITWWAGDTTVSADLAQQTLDAQREEGEEILQRAQDLYRCVDPKAEIHLDFGSPADAILHDTDRQPVDLVAIGGHPRGIFAAWAAGSVGRNLVVQSESSLLIAKGSVRDTGKVDIVIGTDHSEYADHAIDLLVAWNPSGVGNITLVTATELAKLDDSDSRALERQEEIRRGLRQRSETIAKRLQSLNPTGISIEIMDGNPGEVLETTMVRSESELLVLGAKGHGWLDRLAFGSVSYRQAVAQPYPVLLIRADESKAETQTAGSETVFLST